MYCRNCGSDIMQGECFCRKCGSPVTYDIGEIYVENPKPAETNKKVSGWNWKKIGYIYGTIALLAFGLKLFGIFPQFIKDGDHWTVRYRGLTDNHDNTALEAGSQNQQTVQIQGSVQADVPAVSAFIQRHASELQADEYAEGRSTVVGDVGNDGTRDIVVLYSLEGGETIGANNYAQFLAVLSANNPQLIAGPEAVAGKGWRNAELEGIENGRIKLKTVSYTQNDPMCCPSIEGTAYYENAMGKLTER